MESLIEIHADDMANISLKRPCVSNESASGAPITTSARPCPSDAIRAACPSIIAECAQPGCRPSPPSSGAASAPRPVQRPQQNEPEHLKAHRRGRLLQRITFPRKFPPTPREIAEPLLLWISQAFRRLLSFDLRMAGRKYIRPKSANFQRGCDQMDVFSPAYRGKSRGKGKYS